MAAACRHFFDALANAFNRNCASLDTARNGQSGAGLGPMIADRIARI
jgi:hypothetical protein